MLIHRTLTPAALAARRQNARKSTGPRTEEGKRRVAQNGGRTAPPRIWRTPAPGPNLNRRAEKVAQELAEAFQPANAAEQLLVEELARLHFRKRCNQEAQQGLVEKNWSRLARERAEHQRQLTLESSEYPYRLAAAAGYITMDDCPAKFRELSRLLNIVREDVERGNFSREVEDLLKTLYGPGPSMRGARILGNYRALLENGYAPPPPGSSDAGPAATGESEQARAAQSQHASLEAARADLLRALQEEKSVLAARWETYLEENIPSPTAVERAALVPAEDAWRALIYEDQALDRQIETKTRLLLFMQWVRRQQESRPAPLYREGGRAVKA